ncbi:GLUG domain protein [Anaerohalosphaera lusitana]|uniref:GLUG domain protein n=1 Tax=Anaerohalosphaera lusitana TaxID=1936003 RepID=A0A1U9NHE8_9BACT|nr:GLUG motif-containing protein [Anaerohalosphaera lusitana]AQT67174.1 GLUG domain protein [Anaerohalosphaera lusitana]
MKDTRFFLCSVCAVFVFVCGSVFGAGGVLPGDGSEGNPYVIEDIADFNEFADPANSAVYWAGGVHTQLGCDIDLSGLSYSQAVIGPDTDITSINFQGTAYSGSFDGCGFEVAGLTIDDDNVGESFVGLFGYVDGGTVENVGVVDCSISVGVDGGTANHSVQSAGAVCGGVYNGTVSNCYSTGVIMVDVSSSGRVDIFSIGGVVGSFWGTMSGSWSECAITCTGSSSSYANLDRIGGLVGHAEGWLSDCYATGAIEVNIVKGGTGSYINYYLHQIGGLIGKNYDGTIERCYASGDVSAAAECYSYAVTHAIGGLVGYNTGHTSDSYSVGNVTASAAGDSRYGSSYRVGGLMGSNQSEVVNCYAAGGVSASATGSINNIKEVGGLCGLNNGSFSACFWDTEVSGMVTSAGGTGKTTAEMSSETMYVSAGWDFDDTDGSADWRMGSTYPMLIWEEVNVVDLEELALLAEYWGMSGCAVGEACAEVDWYVDGAIDILDMCQLAGSWLGAEVSVSGS